MGKYVCDYLKLIKITFCHRSTNLSTVDVDYKIRKKTNNIPIPSNGLKEQRINPLPLVEKEKAIENRVFRKLDDLPKIDTKNSKFKDILREGPVGSVLVPNRNSSDRKASLKPK